MVYFRDNFGFRNWILVVRVRTGGEIAQGSL